MTTDDGAELLYQAWGSGPPILLANGIGVRYPGLVRQIAALREQYRIICWDYRGIGQSVMPYHADVSIVRHARDALAILDQLRVKQALWVGWSMGVQVALEAIRHGPERVAGLVALLGTCGTPFRNAFPAPVARGAEALFALLQRRPAVLQVLFDAAVALPALTDWLLRRAWFVGAAADKAIMAANIQSVAGVDKQTYLRTMIAMAAHDATDVLEQIRCPALVVAGGRDYLTPPRVARQMAAAIPGARYEELLSGSHFALIEQPEPINRWIAELAERVFAAPSLPAREAAG